jgi:hypothetical protein
MKPLVAAVISLALGFTNSVTAQAASPIQGAILTSDWSCISNQILEGKTLAESVVAKLKVNSPKSTRKGANTTLKFESAELTTVSGSWKSLLLSVKSSDRNYGQKILKMDGDGLIKIGFQTTFPTALKKKLFFLINIHETSPKSALIASCLPTSSFPQPSFSSQTPSNQKQNGNPVFNRINSRIKDLPVPTKSTSLPSIEWILQDASVESFHKGLLEQHSQLSAQYPALYKWDGVGLGVIGDFIQWTPSSPLITGQCSRFITQVTEMWRALPFLEKRLLAGTTECESKVLAAFRPNPSNPIPDGDLMAQEFGGEIQINSQRANPATAQLGRGALNIPNWYLQGGQTGLAFVAHVAAKRSIDGASSKAFVNDECRNVSLESMNVKAGANSIPSSCVYSKGYAALQLMIALYGWDAPTAWFAGFTNSEDFESAFKKAYGDSLSDFNKLADSYWAFLDNPRNVSPELMARLAL